MGRHTGDRVCALGSHIVPCLACSLSFVSFHVEPAGELGLSRHPTQVSMDVTVALACGSGFSAFPPLLPMGTASSVYS